ncbi:uncharacterized protein LOC104582576 [Brachypodium distachyon]|nr:uncharacterized protein LOC104582576 [Brachypodium distachyon]|eukprot:XP_024315041.1 uncharacterized protein LOC104582576 [Brachypodium distachyon]
MLSPYVVSSYMMATMKKLFKMDSATGAASVELWVLMTTLLLVARFLLDFSGPWYEDRAMAATVQVIDMLNYSMVHYTMGLMQLSAKMVNAYFQVWAVLLVTLKYSIKTDRPYGRSSKQIPLLDLMSSFWAANLIRVQTFFLLRIPLWVIWGLNAIRIISYCVSSDRAAAINQENAKLVSDYMRYEHTLTSTGDHPDNEIVRIQWYKYLVCGEEAAFHDARQERRASSSAQPQYRVRLDPDSKKLVTLDKIWNVADAYTGSSGLLGSTRDADNQLKDVCLSFALYKLLRRRFYNLPIHEASLGKTRRLVLNYILLGGYERAFRITEVELSFLKDLFYRKHAAIFARGFPALGMLMSLSLIAATGYLAYPVRHIQNTLDKDSEKMITRGVSVTRLIVALIVIKELSEVYLYVCSQWTKVLMICMYVKHPRLRHPLVEAAMRTMFWFIRRGRWDQMIFQYNLLISYSQTSKKFPRRIKLEPEVKTAIFESFKGLQQHPERIESYFSNAFGSKETIMQQTWATDELEADTHRILVWHIATCLFEIHVSDEVKKLKCARLKNRLLAKKSTTPEDEWPHYLTAVSLSNYCAYLLTKALVPDNGIVVTKVLDVVRKETSRAASSSKSLQDVYKKLMEIAKKPSKESEDAANGEVHDEEHNGQEAAGSSVLKDEAFKMAIDEQDPEGEEQHTGDGDDINGSMTMTNNEQVPNGNGEAPPTKGDDNIQNSVIQMGAELGKLLIETYEAENDRAGLWRDLAVFWTGFLLHLAASTRAAKHKTRLVGKGELITHLWALLSHAGFLGKTMHGQTLLDPDDLDDVDPLR